MKIDLEALKRIIFSIKVIQSKTFSVKFTKILNKEIVNSVIC